jgi:hypothetical protein
LSTTAFALTSDASFIAFKEELETRFKALEAKGDSGLGARFEALKKEMEDALNKIADGSKMLQESLKTLTDSQADIIKRLNIAFDEIRAVGGKSIQKVDPKPVEEVKSEIGVSTLFDWED